MILKALVDTILKKRPLQSSELSDDEKVNFAERSQLNIESFVRAEREHLEITLVEEIQGEKTWFAFRRHVKIEGEPNLSVRGTDSLIRVRSNSVINGASNLLGGSLPEYWGRYFSGIDFRGAGEYFKAVENNFLRNNGIRVLPIGRFTTQVGKGRLEGLRDGKDQAEDLIKTFGEAYLADQGERFYFFLDVEPSDPMSTEYYRGWAEAVQNISSRVDILPCVYLNAGDSTTSSALNAAITGGTACHGLWIAVYEGRFRKRTLPPGIEFNPNLAKPQTTVDAPVLLWQYAGEIGSQFQYDFNISNPTSNSTDLLERLILPQAI